MKQRMRDSGMFSRDRTATAAQTNSAQLDELDAFAPVIKLGDRLTALGQTGSGKTHLVMRLLDEIIPARLPVVVVDTKNAIKPPSDAWRVMGQSLPRAWEREIRRPKRPAFLRLIVRPFPQGYYAATKSSDPILHELWQRIWMQRRVWLGDEWRSPTLVYIDEIKGVTDGNRLDAQLEQLITQGRQPGIMVFSGTQRPSQIPRVFLSEADHRICFRLIDEADRQRATEIFGERAIEWPGPGEHDFWYREPGVAQIEPVLVHQDDE